MRAKDETSGPSRSTAAVVDVNSADLSSMKKSDITIIDTGTYSLAGGYDFFARFFVQCQGP